MDLTQLALVSPAWAQYTISGKVSLQANGEPAVGAAVAIQNTSVQQTTNASGEYQLLNIKPGKYVIIAFLAGCKRHLGKWR
jgi:hypothetical protein